MLEWFIDLSWQQRIKFCCHVLAPVAPRHSIQCLFSLLPFCPLMFPRLHDSAQKVCLVAPRVGCQHLFYLKFLYASADFGLRISIAVLRSTAEAFCPAKISWARALNSCVCKFTFIVLILTLMLSTLMST